MKRRSLVAVLCMLSMLAFAGCGKKTEDVAEVTETEEVAEVEETETVVEEVPVEDDEEKPLDSLEGIPDENFLSCETAYKEFFNDESGEAISSKKSRGPESNFTEDVKVVKAALFRGNRELDPPTDRSIGILVKGTTGAGRECYRWYHIEVELALDGNYRSLGVGNALCLEDSYDTIEEAMDAKAKYYDILDERDFE